MADSARPKPPTPKVALPKIPPWKAPVPSDTTKSLPQQTARGDGKTRQPVDLTAHVGARVQITNTLSRTLVGTIYACDANLVLSTGPFDYHIIPLSKISRYEVLSREESPTKRPADDTASEKDKEKQAKLKEERLVKPPGVSNVGHRLFLMLDKTLPVRWHNKSIFVLDSVLIEPPYGVEDCKAPAKNAKQLERVRELVRNEQERMQKDNTLGRRGG